MKQPLREMGSLVKKWPKTFVKPRQQQCQNETKTVTAKKKTNARNG